MAQNKEEKDVTEVPVSTIVESKDNTTLAADVVAKNVVTPKKETDKVAIDTAGISAGKTITDFVNWVYPTGGWSSTTSGLPRLPFLTKALERHVFQGETMEEEVQKRDDPPSHGQEKLNLLTSDAPIQTLTIGPYYKRSLSSSEIDIIHNARVAFHALQNNQPYANAQEHLDKFNQFFNSEWDSSQYAGPEVAQPFEDVYSTEGQRFNYEKWKNNKGVWQHVFMGKSTAEHAFDTRLELVSFLETISQFDAEGKAMPIPKEVKEIFRDHFVTGSAPDDFLRSGAKFIGGVGDFFHVMLRYSAGFTSAINDLNPIKGLFRQEDGWDKDAFNKTWKEVRNNMDADIKNWKEAFANNTELRLFETQRMNDFVKDHYIDRFGEKAYEENKENILLSSEQVGAIYKHSFDSQNMAAQFLYWLGENMGTAKLFTKAAKYFSTDSLWEHTQMRKWKNTQIKYMPIGAAQYRAGKFSYTAPYKLSSVHQINSHYTRWEKNLATLKQKPFTWFKGLTRQGNLVQAEERIALTRKSGLIDSNIEKAFDLAAEKVRKLTIRKMKITPGSKSLTTIESQLKRANEQLDKAADNWFKHITSVVTKGKTYIPQNYGAAIYRDELFPTMMQTWTYKSWEGTGQEDAAGALAYLGAMFTKPTAIGAFNWSKRKIVKPLANWAWGTGDAIDEGIFTITKFLSEVKYVSDLLGLDGTFDADILAMKMYTKEGDSLRPIPISSVEYERLKYLKDVLGSFDAGLQEEMVRSAKLVNKQTAAIEALLKRKNIDPEVQSRILNSMQLSFGQQSGLDVLGAYQSKLLHSIRPNDIAKFGEKFTAYSQELLKQKDMMQAQSELLNLMRRDMLGLKGDLTDLEYTELESVFKLREEAFNRQQAMFKDQLNEANTAAEKLKLELENPLVYMGLSEKQLEDTMDGIIGTKIVLLEPKTLLERKAIVDNTFLHLIKAHHNSLEEYKNTYETGAKFTDETDAKRWFAEWKGKGGFDRKLRPEQRTIELAGMRLYTIQTKKMQQYLDQIYTPIKNLKDANGKPVRIQVGKVLTNAEGKDSFLNQLITIVGDEEMTSLHSALKVGSDFDKTLDGKPLVRALNEASHNAMIRWRMDEIDNVLANPDATHRDLFPELFDGFTGEPRLDISSDEKISIANSMLKKEMVANADAVKKKYNIATEIKSTQIPQSVYYQFFVAEQGHKLDDISVSYEDLETFRRYLRNKKNKYDPKTQDSKYNDLNRFEAKIEEVLQAEGAKIKLPTPKLDRYGNDTGKLRETNAYELLRMARFNSASMVYSRFRKGELLSNIENTLMPDSNRKFGEPDADYQIGDKGVNVNPNLLNSLGKELLEAVLSHPDDISAHKERLIKRVTKAFGTRRFSSDDWDTKPFTEERINELNSSKNTEFVIDLDTEEGQLAVAQIQAMFLQVIRELQIYQPVLRRGKDAYGVHGYGSWIGVQDINKAKKNDPKWIEKVTELKRTDENLVAFDPSVSLISKNEFMGRVIPSEAERENISTFLSGNGSLGIERYENLEKAMIFPVIKNGKETTAKFLSVDQIIKQELSIEEKILHSQRWGEAHEKFSKQINIEIDANTDAWKNDAAASIDVFADLSNTGVSNGQEFINTYFSGGMPKNDSKMRIVGHKNEIIKNNKEVKLAEKEFRMVINNEKSTKLERKKALQAKNKIIKKVTDSVNKGYRALLLDAVDYMGKNTKTMANPITKGTGMEGQTEVAQTISSIYEDPKAAFKFMDSQIVRDLFEEFGVSTKRYKKTATGIDETVEASQYDSMMGVLGHLVIVSEWEKAASIVPGTIPYTGYTDTGLMSRAFNYARGMVGGPYLAVEAGFKIMKDNNMNVLHWMLNSPEAASFINKALTTQEPISKREISTFVDRMAAWIASETVRSGNELVITDVEEMRELIKKAEEEDPELDFSGIENLYQADPITAGLTGARDIAVGSAIVGGTAAMEIASEIGELAGGAYKLIKRGGISDVESNPLIN